MTDEIEVQESDEIPRSAVVDRSLIEYIPPGGEVPPCPFPCSICVEKGRQ
ncbi:hypothetical protein [Streptantibioticus ferralitis]|uniref:Uncharacterized protein n=1 Tax=Streptantibioticus ferralitis TaxID=236510 RepID=A0ABT5YZ97_9ACTN|nr:hypothetical protein [Streptantibioticus ferralitis]MDF2256926.1 hypothetical protein [Streptantibioticus ferralitis]